MCSSNMKLQNNLHTETGWEIIQNFFDPEQIVTTGSNFMIGNGYLGYRGTFENWGPEEFVACIVTDTWDQAPGSRWSELCNVPNGLFSEIKAEGEVCSLFPYAPQEYSHCLDLRYGLNTRAIQWKGSKGQSLEIESRKFASYDNHHLLVQEFRLTARSKGVYTLKTGIDGDIWSLNGSHFKTSDPRSLPKGLIGIELKTHELGTKISVVEGVNLTGIKPDEAGISTSDTGIFREYTFQLAEGDTIEMQKVVAITHNNELEDPLNQGQEMVIAALQSGYKELWEAHQKHWEAFWDISDIRIAGNLEDQVLIRFNLYQAFIATPTHANLPVGARGLSCQVYQGAAFWDQETYNLPMFAYTHPEIARRLVAYRYDTLAGAKRKASALGYYGAFYAWTSGKTGDELFPDFFFTDVLTGRLIRNHFNCWQIHISPDVVYGIWMYYQATGDWDFMVRQGAEVLFEVAQFLVSRVHFKKDKDRYEIIRVLGPDEYHENVDNNAFTNYLSRFALQKACEVYDRLKSVQSENLKAISARVGLPDTVRDDWQDISEKLFLPQPDSKTGVIEQFNGYFKLEDIEPDTLRKRLIHPEEYWGWPNGIAVHTQVLKQADVIQLLAMLDGFPQEVLTANYDYYEPRTEHGSSLSPSVHALVASKADHPEEAYRYFLESAGIDLYNASKKVMSGGSFLGGIHTAAAGGVWLIIVKGFAGLVLTENGVSFKPALPSAWESLAFKIRIRGCLLTIKMDASGIDIFSPAANPLRLHISANGHEKWLNPGDRFKG